jgi:sugar (pentulose or hexulose) kinase
VAEACRAAIQVVDELAPEPAATRRYEGYYQLYRNLYRQLKDSFDEAQKLVEAERSA